METHVDAVVWEQNPDTDQWQPHCPECNALLAPVGSGMAVCSSEAGKQHIQVPMSQLIAPIPQPAADGET